MNVGMNVEIINLVFLECASFQLFRVTHNFGKRQLFDETPRNAVNLENEDLCSDGLTVYVLMDCFSRTSSD